VISTRSNSADPGGRNAWVELSVDPLRPTKICVGGRYSERTNFSVKMLLMVVDEVAKVVAEGDVCRGVLDYDPRSPLTFDAKLSGAPSVIAWRW